MKIKLILSPIFHIISVRSFRCRIVFRNLESRTESILSIKFKSKFYLNIKTSYIRRHTYTHERMFKLLIFASWYKSINSIRWHHKISTRMSKQAGIGEIYQKDMVLTQFSFVGYIAIAPRSFGLNMTLEEEEAFNHFWRVNGYMLGITDKLNLCRKNAKETIELCYKIKDLYGTYLSNGSPEFYETALQTLNGLWFIDITADIDSFMAFVFKLHGLPDKKIGWRSWLIMKYREWLFYLCLVPYIRVIVRAYTNLFIQLVLWNAYYCPILAWIRFGKNNARINLYPKH